MKIEIRKCKGRKKTNKAWHACDMLYVWPFEKSCPNGCKRKYYVIRVFESEMPCSEDDNSGDV